MRDMMQLFRSDTHAPVSANEFPEVFAVCRGSNPYLQFQILTLEQTGFVGNGSRHYTFVENDRIRNINFVLENYENRRSDSYLVGQITAVNSERDHFQPPQRVRFEVRRIYLQSNNMRIPIVFVDPISVLPQPKNLIVPLNVERQYNDNQHDHMIQNEVLNPNNYSNYRIPHDLDLDHRFSTNDDAELNYMRNRYIRPENFEDVPIRRRRRVSGEVPHTPPVRPRGDEPAAAAAAPPPVPALSRFTVNAILNQAILEEMTCPISMTRIDKNTAGVTSCQHVFERQSISRWLSDHDTCPVCRAATQLVQV